MRKKKVQEEGGGCLMEQVKGLNNGKAQQIGLV